MSNRKRRALAISLACVAGFFFTVAAAAYVIAPWVHGPDSARIAGSATVVLLLGVAVGLIAVGVSEP